MADCKRNRRKSLCNNNLGRRGRPRRRKPFDINDLQHVFPFRLGYRQRYPYYSKINLLIVS